jgi:OFA family oxalate/formate antiporter-like MFS transporter
MKYGILLASVVMQTCLGGLYAWTSFVPALTSSHGLSTAQTQVIFGALIAVFTVAMVFAGRLLERWGPRLVAGTGSLLLGLGYLIASFSGGEFSILLLGIGVVAGVGTGFGYVCPLATCMKWFPTHKGLVTGIAVAGFGGGAVLLSALAEWLLSRGVSVLMVFRWLGICYGAATVAAALVLRFPASSATARRQPIPMVSALMRDPFFWALVAGMFCGTFAGLLVIGNLKPMALSGGIPPRLVVGAICAFAVGNATGRIVWGQGVDRFGVRAISVSLAALAVALCGLFATRDSAMVFVSISALIGFGFGACFVIYAALVATRYSPERFACIYPLVFLAYGAAGITGPWVGGWLYDRTAGYNVSIALGIAVVVAGLSASAWLIRTAREPVGQTAANGRSHSIARATSRERESADE